MFISKAVGSSRFDLDLKNKLIVWSSQTIRFKNNIKVVSPAKTHHGVLFGTTAIASVKFKAIFKWAAKFKVSLSFLVST